MRTLKSSAEDLTLNADGSGNDIKFQSNGVEKASIDQDGVIASGGITIGSVGSVAIDSADLKITGTDDIFFNVAGASNNILQLYGGGSANDQSKFDSHVYPLTDNTKDLGNATERWKDLYLSGGLLVGGTGAANTLDDYEEGTWTPAVWGGGTITTATGIYTRIGRVVHAAFYISYGTTTSSDAGGFQGLPFSTISNNAARDGHSSYSDHGSSFYVVPLDESDRVVFFDLSGSTLLNSAFSDEEVYGCVQYHI